MGLALNGEVALTTRRAGGRLNVYPRLLRDGSMLPRITLAINYFESLLGHEQQELQPAMLVELFADPRLARGISAALGSSYRFRPRRIEEVVGRAAGGRLKRAGLASAPGLRLWLYDQLNDEHHGFLSPRARLEVWPRLESALRLRAGQLDQLLYLDRPEHLRLQRVGATPRPADVAARYNVLVLECLLRHAERVELAIDRPAVEAALELAAAAQVDAVFDPASKRLRLLGRQDALGGWARYGRHLARATIELLERGRGAVTDGEAQVALRGRTATLRLGPDVLDLLGGPPALAAGWESDALAQQLRTSATNLRSLGWRVRVQPEAYVCQAGVVLPDLLVQPGPEAPACLLVAVRGPGHARRLAHVAPGATTAEQLVFLGSEADVAELRGAGAHVVGLPAVHEAGLGRTRLARLLHAELAAEAAAAA